MEPDRRPSAVAEMFRLSTFGRWLLQGMVAFADHQDEPLLVSQVVCVRDASLFPAAAFPFADFDAVLGDEFPINLDGIFSARDRAGDVPVEPMSQVTGRDELHDGFR